MTDLRKAAEMALEALEEVKSFGFPTRWDGCFDEEIQALRQALVQPDEEELLKQGWRKCAVGQRTTQYCDMAEQARLEEREACARICEEELAEWGEFDSDVRDVCNAIRARGNHD